MELREIVFVVAVAAGVYATTVLDDWMVGSAQEDDGENAYFHYSHEKEKEEEEEEEEESDFFV